MRRRLEAALGVLAFALALAIMCAVYVGWDGPVGVLAAVLAVDLGALVTVDFDKPDGDAT